MDPARPKLIPRRRARRRLPAAAAAAAAATLLAVAMPAHGDVQSRIDAGEAQAQRLRSAIAAETERIQATADGLAQARARLGELQGQARARQDELARVERRLVQARGRLTRLENRMRVASQLLADNLVAAYEGDRPDVATVLLEAHGFSDLLERMDFLRRVSRQNAQILADTKTTRAAVIEQTKRLAALQERDRRLTEQVTQARDQAAAVQTAMLRRQEAQLRGRDGRQAELDAVRGRLSALRARQERAIAAARRAAAAQAPAGTTTAGGPAPSGIRSDPGGQAQAPAGAPAAVAQVIAAGNAIAGLPYSYGGGHASFQAGAYDCSGSVSYALAAAGLVSSPLDSTAFESWGEPGPGRWITVYANAGHAFMVVAGWRFDTVALSSGGTRWTRTMTSTAGFVARHPAGL